MAFVIKVVVSAFVIALVSEVAKRSAVIGSIVIALPLNSLLVILWLYRDTGDIPQISRLSLSIFWTVLPTLLFFIVFPCLLKQGFKFYSAIGISSVVMMAGFAVYVAVLNRLGIKI